MAMNELQDGVFVEVFRAGDYSRTHGMKVTPEELQAMADNYNPRHREAMLKIGHDPFFGRESFAHGWVTELKAVAGSLYAKFLGISDEVKKLTKSGALRKRSAEILPAKYSETKVPEFWGVALLGGSQPGVAGMADFDSGNLPKELRFVEFCEQGETDSDADSTETDNEGAKMADNAEVAALQEKVIGLQTELSKRPTVSVDDFKALQQQVEAAKKFEEERAQLTDQLKAERRAATESRVKALFDGLKAAGKSVPAFENSGIKPVLIALSENDIKVQIDGKETAGFDVLCSFLSAMPQIVDFDHEIAGGPVDDPKAVPATDDFKLDNLPNGTDDDEVKVYKAAMKLMQQTPGMDYRTACEQVSKWDAKAGKVVVR